MREQTWAFEWFDESLNSTESLALADMLCNDDSLEPLVENNDKHTVITAFTVYKVVTLY